MVHIAGQIGLVPGSMSLIPGGVGPEGILSLRHVERILETYAMTLKNAVQVGKIVLSDFISWLSQKFFYCAKAKVQ